MMSKHTSVNTTWLASFSNQPLHIRRPKIVGSTCCTRSIVAHSWFWIALSWYNLHPYRYSLSAPAGQGGLIWITTFNTFVTPSQWNGRLDLLVLLSAIQPTVKPNSQLLISVIHFVPHPYELDIVLRSGYDQEQNSGRNFLILRHCILCDKKLCSGMKFGKHI